MKIKTMVMVLTIECYYLKQSGSNYYKVCFRMPVTCLTYHAPPPLAQVGAQSYGKMV
uniref:Uncharacterized protein n=1 Tax=Anguilla anguilla TaxID=7936 RepID=A0A0E9VK09_ANGAN